MKALVVYDSVFGNTEQVAFTIRDGLGSEVEALRVSAVGYDRLQGLEYLIVQNNYHSALKFLQLVRDQIAIYDSVMIATISPSTLSEKDLKLIEREMEPLTLEGG